MSYEELISGANLAFAGNQFISLRARMKVLNSCESMQM